MLPRNLNVILIALSVAVMCYVTNRSARPAMMVGNALEMINLHYVDPVDPDKLLIAAMNGMTSSLDENSSYVPGEAYVSLQNSINQEFAGIGIFVEQPDKNKPVRVITPLVGSPALRSGILPDDRIVTVDDVDVSKMPLQEVSEKLKGRVGTVVKVGLLRGDGERLSISVQRATINLPSVVGDHRSANNEWVYRLKSNRRIAYIRLSSFGEKTVDELTNVLVSLNNDFDGLVLDVRGNSGGLLYAARDISNMFLNEGRIVSTRTRGNQIEDVYDAQSGTLVDPSIPMVVMIDGGSASASEIVAAALQDNKRATVVGTRSYGKGTVQKILPLQFGRSALRLTVARYYRPNDKNIHRKPNDTEQDEWGVTPDKGFVVDVDEETLLKLGMRWREASYPLLSGPLGDESERAEPNIDFDPQLRRGVDHLIKQIGSESPQKSDLPESNPNKKMDEHPAQSAA